MNLEVRLDWLSKTLHAIGLLLVLTLMAAPSGNAQVLYGTLVGNVTDATGAGIPNAAVKITNMGTSQEWKTTTGALGAYSVPTIPPGAYEVAISAQGFRAFTRRIFPLQ